LTSVRHNAFRKMQSSSPMNPLREERNGPPLKLAPMSSRGGFARRRRGAPRACPTATRTIRPVRRRGFKQIRIDDDPFAAPQGGRRGLGQSLAAEPRNLYLEKSAGKGPVCAWSPAYQSATRLSRGRSAERQWGRRGPSMVRCSADCRSRLAPPALSAASRETKSRRH
jgi:hypothetical protein